MPRFAYRAKDSALKIVEGTIEADSETSAISLLGSRGVFPISIAETASASAAGLSVQAPLALRKGVAPRTLAYTTRQLADLLGGGLPLLSALTLLARQTEHATLARVIDALAVAVRDGRALGDALAQHPAVFPPLYVSMVKAGEVSGGLEQALARLAELGENEAELRSRVLGASAYPIFVLLVACGMTVFLMAYVIPALAQVFTDSGQLLPLPTRILLGISHALTQWWWAALGVAAALGMALRQWHASASGKAALDRLLISLPGVGGLARKLDTARFARNLGAMINQGVPVLQALDVVSRNVSNTVVRRAIVQVEGAVREGSSIAAALMASGQFPVFVSNMVAVGEESGTVDAALLKVAVSYEREVGRTIATLTTVLEPLLLLGVGGVVMFIVLAMLLPVFQIGLVAQ